MITIILVCLAVLVFASAIQRAPLDATIKNGVSVILLVCLGVWLLRQAGVV